SRLTETPAAAGADPADPSRARRGEEAAWYRQKMGERLAFAVSLIAVLLLGVTAGAMLAEAAILVPYWRSLAPADFFDWYAAHAPLLVDFYSPLEVVSTVAALACAGLYSAQSRPGASLWWVAAVLSIAVLGTFFVFFKEANEGFSSRSIADGSLPAALESWAAWQWGRVIIGMSAFAAGVLAIRAEGNTCLDSNPSVAQQPIRNVRPWSTR
ncbi:MAG: hypothetical protein WBG86_10675, partial [Polyangiales bacterium]